MTDNQLRGLLLQRYYERRREPRVRLESRELGGRVTGEEIARVSAQLLEHGLIEGRASSGLGPPLRAVDARITFRGIDVVEGGATPPIAIHLFQDNSVTVSGSQGVAVGDHNAQTVVLGVGMLGQEIDGFSSATEPERREARSRLDQLLALPIVKAILNAANGKRPK